MGAANGPGPLPNVRNGFSCAFFTCFGSNQQHNPKTPSLANGVSSPSASSESTDQERCCAVSDVHRHCHDSGYQSPRCVELHITCESCSDSSSDRPDSSWSRHPSPSASSSLPQPAPAAPCSAPSPAPDHDGLTPSGSWGSDEGAAALGRLADSGDSPVVGSSCPAPEAGPPPSPPAAAPLLAAALLTRLTLLERRFGQQLGTFVIYEEGQEEEKEEEDIGERDAEGSPSWSAAAGAVAAAPAHVQGVPQSRARLAARLAAIRAAARVVEGAVPQGRNP